MITLRKYQETAVDGVRDEYARGYNRVILVMPTGAGKTVVFSHITRITAANGKRVLVLAHRKELLTQCGDKLGKNDVLFGYLNPAFTPNLMFNVQVGTMQTVVKRMAKLNFEPDLIIVDECHRAMSKTYQDILKYYHKARILGVTATPVRGDGRPLGEFFDRMVLGPTIKELIAMGALVPIRTFGPDKIIDLSNVDVVRQEDGSYDYDKKQVEKIIDTKGITDDVVARYREKCSGLPAIAFCVSVLHAKHVAADFNKAGFKFETIYGAMPDRDRFDAEGNLIERGRTSVLNDLEAGIIDGITSVDLATEGLDIPRLTVAIMLRPTQSEGLYLQMGGRVLRAAPGKECAYMLDHAGCSLTHRLVTSDRHWVLEVATKDKRKKKKSAEKPIVTNQCPKCFLVHEPGPVCPDCGYVYVIEGNLPQQKRGHLVEITEEQGQFLEFLANIPTTPLEIRKEIANAKTFDDLRVIEKRNGYKSGWAARTWAGKNRKQKIV